MDDMDNLQWLIENGGPTIKLYMLRESLVDKNTFDAEKTTFELLQHEPVQKRFSYFDAFKNFKGMAEKDLYSLIHSCYDYCYEQFMPFLTNKVGFSAGYPEFDVKVSYMRDIYLYLTTPRNSNELHWSHVYGTIIISNMLRAGYYYNDMLDYMTTRIINKVHKIAELGIFDFYETDPSKIKHSKLPKNWKDVLIIKDIHNCEIGEIPLPTGYHITGMLSLYKYINDNETKKKINDILDYITDPRYQKLHGNYGIHWDDAKKAYHASSGGIDLPFYDSNELNKVQKWCFLDYPELLSRSPHTCKTEVMKKCLNYLEQYKTEYGTYIFPEDLLYPVLLHKANMQFTYQIFISKETLSKIKSVARKSMLFELYSTYYMAMLKNRFQYSN